MDADDYLNVDILEKMYTIAKECNVSLVRWNYQTVLGTIKMEDKCSWSDINGSQIVNLSQNRDYIVTETPRIVELYKSKNALFNFDMNRLNKYINERYRNVIETQQKVI